MMIIRRVNKCITHSVLVQLVDYLVEYVMVSGLDLPTSQVPVLFFLPIGNPSNITYQHPSLSFYYSDNASIRFL
jgi:hypothetical protein